MAPSASALLDSCLEAQKLTMYGANRTHSCDSCDVHLSEAEWLENHLRGEKHRWVAARVGNLLPVQWQQQQIQLVPPRAPHLPPEFLCCTCGQGFWPMEKYRKHLGSLYHLRRCAGEAEGV